METSKQLYEVEIAGFPLKLRSSHDRETVQKLVDLVDSKVSEAMQRGSGISFQNALMLSALHIAEDLVKLRHAVNASLGSIEGQAKDILDELETSPISRIRLDN